MEVSLLGVVPQAVVVALEVLSQLLLAILLVGWVDMVVKVTDLVEVMEVMAHMGTKVGMVLVLEVALVEQVGPVGEICRETVGMVDMVMAKETLAMLVQGGDLISHK